MSAGRAGAGWAATEVAAQLAGQASSDVITRTDVAATHPAPPERRWTPDALHAHVSLVSDALLIRATQAPRHVVDQAVTLAENGVHAGHGGWVITPALEVVCGGGRVPCGRVLFPLAEKLTAIQMQELLRSVDAATAGRSAA